MVKEKAKKRNSDSKDRITSKPPNSVSEDVAKIIEAVAANTELRIAYLNRDFQYIWVNSSYADGIGFEPRQLIGKSHFELLPNPEYRALLQKIIDSGQKATLRDTSSSVPKQKENVITYWDVTGYPTKDTLGRITGLVLVILETTERKKNEIQLEQTAREWSNTFDSVPDFISIHNLDGKIIRANLALSKALNLSLPEIIGKPCYEILHKTHQFLTGCPHLHTIATKAVSQKEVFEPSLGLYLEIITSPIFDSSGTLIGSVHITRDITLRKKIERVLREFEQRLELALTATQEGIWDWNTETHEVWYSPRWKEMLGYSSEEIEPHISAWERLLHPDDIPRVRKTVEGVMKGESDYVLEFRMKHKDGHYMDILSRGIPVRKEAGGPVVRIVGTHFDLTERKRIGIELERLYQAEKELRIKLENEIKKRVEFTHALVHELKTPLTPVLSSSEALTRLLEEGITLRLAKNVYDGALELDHRIDELLELARMEVGTFKVRFGPTDLIKLIANTVDYLKQTANKNNQVINTNLPESSPVITADADRLRQVLLNLLNNAMQHTPAGSVILISAGVETDGLTVEVKDNGKGISEDLQQRLFDQYYRIKGDAEGLGGLGLGLPISKHIIELHGGRIWVKSKIGEGSTFGFFIPFVHSTPEKEA